MSRASRHALPEALMEASPPSQSDGLRQAIREIADQLCLAVDGRLDFTVRTQVADHDAEKLVLLVNFLLESAARVLGERARHAAALDRLVNERSAMLQTVFENVVDGLIVSDEQGRIEHGNPAACRLFGFDNLTGHHVTELMPERYRSEHAGYIQRYLDTREARIVGSSRELEGRRRDGTHFPLRLAISEARTDGTGRFIALLRDISQEKAQEAALRQAKEAAESASQAKSRFLAGMSHELRTPLNAVIGYSELILEEIEDGLPPDSIRSDLEAIRSAGRHLLGLINNVLDLSRIEAGHTDVIPESFEPGMLTRIVATTAKPLISGNGNEFIVDIADDLPLLCNDAGKLRQCLLNLLGNAAKFTERGRVRLSVAGGSLPNQAPAIVWRVADTGIGIEEDQLEHIFETFTQADSSIGRHYGGSGLGLALTASMCRVLGGHISAASTPGVGSSFTITLPLDGIGEAE
jgi:PAS domain S-box-containing protein